MSPSDRTAQATAGFAVAACCAAPIVGFLAAAGLLTALGVALLGVTAS